MLRLVDELLAARGCWRAHWQGQSKVDKNVRLRLASSTGWQACPASRPPHSAGCGTTSRAGMVLTSTEYYPGRRVWGLARACQLGIARVGLANRQSSAGRSLGQRSALYYFRTYADPGLLTLCITFSPLNNITERTYASDIFRTLLGRFFAAERKTTCKRKKSTIVAAGYNHFL